ncbi:hypothetical protein B0H16DRAFT_1532892 [Mycena metata]|uniref:BTB domain-containing protein n=1 Tax=Mycena metata TaxID=1033252 RepID=A0AAD7NGE8_9AGAR|nr:hypothetical protein B0H16DRAFT_1532892 [Mycena metata]
MGIETSSAATANLTHAEGLWFEDCGLIIQAETTLFRVSRDFLAMRSPVFADMLSMPTPKDAEMIEGCPFVRLPDAAQDITYFLKALIYSEFFEPWPAKASSPVVAGVLRMSHKYQVARSPPSVIPTSHDAGRLGRHRAETQVGIWRVSSRGHSACTPNIRTLDPSRRVLRHLHSPGH